MRMAFSGIPEVGKSTGLTHALFLHAHGHILQLYGSLQFVMCSLKK